MSKFKEITLAYLPLSFTTFAGPAAHIALFLDKFVKEKSWVTEATFIELFSVAQSLPGPASTQLAFALALVRAGPLLAIYSFFIWSLPCMIIMSVIGIGVGSISNMPPEGLAIQNGLTSAAVGLILLAAYKLSEKILVTNTQRMLTLISGSMAISFSFPWLFPCLMIFGGCVMLVSEYLSRFMAPARPQCDDGADLVETAVTVETGNMHAVEVEFHISYTARTGVVIFFVWLILFGLSIGVRTIPERAAQVLGTFYFTGSIIFGGGPVVIPLLAQYTVNAGWLTDQEFLIGLAIINALPGPMFNFAAYLGALSMRKSTGESILGAFLAYTGIFMPGLLLQSALIPIWSKYRQYPLFKLFFSGINASAVGLIWASVYLLGIRAIVGEGISPISILSYPIFVIIAATSYLGVGYFGVPTPLMVVLGGLIGYLTVYSSI